ncbi:unnamed protein product [Bursaphelenchus okinawaensis]|uniref:MD-2-related lipid-recognition domain-containing protein n=1 Tax=Bursaphelenchus okinawaensis TaxID=465554 RepID=A0A811LCI2_9BILA|nr:unnamed protein product [Bursaphelenchus okinawaensis]CAG9120369.1 unnamed protein product [Bursaphelenchus okinawaensis]
MKLFLLCFLATVSAFPQNVIDDVHVLEDCAFPNNTDTKFHTYNCDDNVQIQVIDAVVLNRDTQQEIYPVDVKVPLLIKLRSKNNGDPITSNKVDVELAEFSKSWVTRKCQWNSVPTFGLLKNIDGCEFAKNCPLQSGDLDLLLPLDLSKYSKILKFLTGNKAYQLKIVMKDDKNENRPISCVMAQLKFSS